MVISYWFGVTTEKPWVVLIETGVLVELAFQEKKSATENERLRSKIAFNIRKNRPYKLT